MRYYALSFILFCLMLPGSLIAQTWKPVGLDEVNNPSVEFSPYTCMAIAPDGTPYIAYNDNTLTERVTVKKFDGAKWIVVGQPGFSEGYYASDISIVFAPDGTPYVTYVPTVQGQNSVTISVRKLIGNQWVKVSSNIGDGLGPTLAFTSDGTPYVAFNAGSVSGWSVSSFTTGWQNVGSSYSYGSNLSNSSKIVVSSRDSIFIAYVGTTQKVSVRKLVSGNWQLVGTDGFSNAGASSVTMAIDSMGTIYAAYSDASNSGKAMIQQYKGGIWSVISSTGISLGAATCLKLAIAPDQTPYITFSDAGNASKATVKKYYGGNWVNVGSGAISLSSSGYNDLSIDKMGVIYTIYQDNSINAEITVKKFSNNQWTDVGMGDVSPEPAAGLNMKLNKGDTTYVAFTDAFYGNRASVKRFVAGVWQYTGTPGISPASVTYMDMDLGPDGTPYLFFSDLTNRDLGVVDKYTGTTWQQVGAAITSSGGGISETKIVIAPDGTPYTAYSDNGQFGSISVQKFINGSWTLVGAAGFSGQPVGNINLAVDLNGIPYTAYIDNSGTATVQMFNGSGWVSIGNITAANVSNLNLAVSPTGIPYVAYHDPLTAKIAVQSYVNNAWALVGGIAASDLSSDNPKLTFGRDGQVYLGLIQLETTANFETVKKLAGGKWVNAGNTDIKPNNRLSDAVAITSAGNLLYAYTAPQVFVRTLTSDSLAAAPVITACTPNYGSTGSIATITGFNFSSTSKVSFGSSQAASFTVISPTEITAVVGLGASGLVSVTNTYGTGTFSGYVFSPKGPVIRSFSPHSASIGAIVTIQGRNFNSAADSNIVYFGAVTATVVSANDSTLIVKVPAGSTYSPLSVTTRNLTGWSSIFFDVTFEGKGIIDSNAFATKMDVKSVANPSEVLVVDADGDGKPDIVVNAGPVLLHHNLSTVGHLDFSPVNIMGGGFTEATADFDGDGKTDLCYAEVSVSVGINKSISGTVLFPNLETFQPVNYPFDIATCDLDGDGRPDIVTADNEALEMTILRNAGSSKGYTFFDDENDLATLNSFPDGVVVADLDGDGKPDIIAKTPNFDAAGTYNLQIFKNNSDPGQMSFTLVAQVLTGSKPGKPFIADIDGDGKPDMVIPNGGSNTVSVMKNTSTPGNISFAPAVNFTTGKTPVAVCVADLDGDGKPDVAVTNQQDNTVSVFRNTGTAGAIAFAAKVDFATGHSPASIAAADLDGDGAPELIIGNYADSTISILRNNMGPNTITFAQPATVTYGAADTKLTATSTDAIHPITFVSSNNAIVSIVNGNQAHIIGAGSVTITCQQSESTALSVSRIFTVLPAPLTITALDAIKLTGNNNPPLVLNYKGFVNGDDTTAFISAPIVSTTATPASAAGIYPITVSGAVLTNYVIKYQKGTLTVENAPPLTNFIIAATSATCRGSNNGIITITAAQQMNYTVQITGNGQSSTSSFIDSVSFSGLAAGTYHVCISVAGQNNFQQCDDVVISEPADLSVYTTIDDVNNQVTLLLSGSSQYHITLNGAVYSTTDDVITLPLNEGNNNLTVTTDKLCQGTVQKQITLPGKLIPYPDPCQNYINLNLGSAVVDNVTVQLNRVSDGSLVYSKQFNKQSGILQLDVSSVDKGVYVLHLNMDHAVKIFKIVKE